MTYWANRLDMIGIEILFDPGEGTIGAKRQRMIENAMKEYVVFIDADDEISDNYLDSIITALRTKPDCVGFRGWMTTNGTKRQDFWISKTLPYESFKNYHLRHTNHLCPIKRSIALQVGYKDLSFGEDYDYAVRLKESGLIRTEVFIDEELYHYKYVTKRSNKPGK